MSYDLFVGSALELRQSGNQSLNNINFSTLKNNVFIASCTSNDDEFEMSLRNKILETHSQRNVYGHLEQYVDRNKIINLLHKGNAVNFIYNATNGPFIYSVLVGLIISAIKIIRNETSDREGFNIRELDRTSMERVAKIWLQVFENYNDLV